MSAGPLLVEIVGLFFLVLYLLYRYADFRRQNKLILVATFIAWYFSFMIVILLPMDISMTVYRQCSDGNKSSNANSSNENPNCHQPWSIVSETVFHVLWRIIYWSSQALTWLILPFMQSFCQSGEFTLSGKMRAALIANAIYYGTYLAIFGVLLIYVAIKNNIDGQNLKVIGITASNTWGLFLLVLLLGYGLVALPRSLWNKSITSLRLKQIYFKIAKLHGEKCEAEENLEDILNEIKTIAEKIKYNNPLRQYVDIMVKKCPDNFQNNVRRNVEDFSDYDENLAQRDIPSEKSLVNLHTRLINSLQVNNRTTNQWDSLIKEAFFVEDILVNETNSNRTFMTTNPIDHHHLYNKICNPALEWWYHCIVGKFTLKLVSALFAVVTLMVIWSEMTFFSKKPVLSLFAIFLDRSRKGYNYFGIEFIACFTIAYLCFCAYYAIFRIRIFNYYYLAANHHTSENSLIFSGTLVCRLTSPLCYNFLGLMHLDSHITKDKQIYETVFTQIMGHMDVISFISDGFNIYFPFLIFILCLATFFNLGGRILHFFGFEQFIGDPDVTQDLIEDGKNLVKREKRILQRNDPETQSRHRQVADRLRNNYSNLSNKSYGNVSNDVNNDSQQQQSQQQSSSSATSSKFSMNNLFSSSMSSLLNKKDQRNTFRPQVREYRDIPSDADTDSAILTNLKNDSRSDYESTIRSDNDNLSTSRQQSQSKRGLPSRNIFDDV